MLSKLTLLGVHNFTEGHIWDDILLPEGVNKDLLIDEIIREAAEFSLVYPDADYLSYQIKSFFLKWNKNFTKWIDVYNTNYNPLYNVEVHTETDQEVIDKNKANETHMSASSSQAATSGTNNAQTDSDGLNQTQKAAYDANTFKNVEQESNTNFSSTSIDSSTSSSELSSESTSDSSSYENSNSMHMEEYKYGNQGVTMSQEMWLAEVDMWYWNLYKHIAEIFVNELIESKKQLIKANKSNITSLELQIGNYRELLKKYVPDFKE